ncbi:MAG: glycosyltransferase family 4 protein [Prevotellaceae bacterium]|nr:glycosyltransferase family 4 protein [Prevotellaceae bacterium]
MNLLYLTMSPVTDINAEGVHTDFLRKFRDEGHNVSLVSPRERKMGLPTSLKEQDGIRILGVRTLNVTRANIVEKGLGQVSIEYLFKRAIRKYFRGLKFDIIAYATPPITFVGAIKYVKKLNPQAMTYLLLKDIFPQNAVDLGMLSNSGLNGFLYRSFRRKEKELYRISDWIGCMSLANVKYVIDHNPEVNPGRVEVCPNTFAVPVERSKYRGEGLKMKRIREKYGLPVDKPVFLYGGNLGKPQGIPFLIKCLEANRSRKDCHFLIVGNGTYYPFLEKWYNENENRNITIMKRLSSEDYNILARSCDVGLIFLDYRFTIPNYPSRLLSYLIQHKPIIACTDSNCDTGTIAEANSYGFWCPSNSVEAFTKAVDKMLASDIKQMGKNGYKFFLENYTVQNTYDTIMKHFQI